MMTMTIIHTTQYRYVLLGRVWANRPVETAPHGDLCCRICPALHQTVCSCTEEI